MGHIKSVSYSRLKVFEKCPYWAFLQFVDKRPTDHMDTTAADRGSRVHQEAEDFVKQGGPLTKELKKSADRLMQVKAQYEENPESIEIEEEWGFDADWCVTDYWGDQVWFRMKLDQFIWNDFPDNTYATPVDLKTGKRFGNEVSHSQQGQIYAIGAFLRYPTLEVADVVFDYLDHGQQTKKTYTREKAMQFLDHWDRRAKAMTEAESFPPKPNKINCMFCPFGPNRGDGSCEWGVDG